MLTSHKLCTDAGKRVHVAAAPSCASSESTAVTRQPACARLLRCLARCGARVRPFAPSPRWPASQSAAVQHPAPLFLRV